jgi:hypothetical protein
MPNRYFDDDKKEKAIDWIQDKWPEGKRTCECCSASSWTVADDLICPLNIIREGIPSFGAHLYPSVLLVCNNCGNSKLFNAVKMGIVSPNTTDEDKEIEVSKEDEKKDPCKGNNFIKCILNKMWCR